MRTVIGLMSGTSLDGVDAAVLETDGERIGAFGPSLTLPYDPALRRGLRALLDRLARTPTASIDPADPETAALERAVTLAYADAIAALDAPAATLVGMHGQTVLHRPAEARTWQLGDAALLAALTGRPVVHDFRKHDLQAGGEGAPLAPLFHAALLPAAVPRPAALLNLGGVANLTWIGADGALLACDTGPGNALLDDWALQHTAVACDTDGALARAGTVHAPTLATLLGHPFFRRPAPKSLDRLSFAHALALVQPLSAADGAATLTAFTAAAIRLTALPAPPASWFACGGGRHNPALMAALRHELVAPVHPVEALGLNGDALEAQCFAFLAMRSVRGLPLSLPGTTGVLVPTTGGRLTPAP